jgi:hypothetical protein
MPAESLFRRSKMSRRNGDRSRFNRERKAKIARRLRWREAVKKSTETSSTKTSPKAG